MTVYVLAKIEITDREEYARYEAGFMDIFARYAGRVMSVDEAPTVLEGTWTCTRTVLLEFSSEEDALAWYESDDYQSLAQHRFAASSADVVVLAGAS